MPVIKQMEVTSVSSKGQVVIPGGIRQSLRITAGTKLFVLTDGTNVLLKPLPTSRLTEFKKLIHTSRQLTQQRSLQKKNLSKLIKQTRYAGGA